ncbi:MAG: hypothetical protein FJ260_08495 [Planctomycetes bacterium]|nr:hypothetical protein [Planctomycetota bacterium]
MSLLSRIPWPSHPGASCEERERNSALAALVLCFLLAIGLVVSAMLLVHSDDPVVADADGTTGAGYGTGSGSGLGAGVGRGSALSGDGPGAGKAGERSGASGTRQGEAPTGQRLGTVAEANAKEGESLVAGESKEPPKFGFTPNDDPDPIVPPQTAVAVGRPDGSDGEGRAGAGGGGGSPGFMGIKTDARSVVYILDFSASMRDQDDRRDEVLKRELTASIAGLPKDARFQVVLFGVGHRNGTQINQPADKSSMFCYATTMPPGTMLPADARHRGAAAAWVQSREPDPEGASEPWGAMKLALELQPEAIFLLTDGEFPPGEPDRLSAEVAANNTPQGVQINTIAFAVESDIPSLQALAANNKGTYRRVTLKR